MRDLQEQTWLDLKQALEDYVHELELNESLERIRALGQKIRELEERLANIKLRIAGVFYTFQRRPDAILRMHLGETPDFV